jgi:hypothetical protein
MNICLRERYVPSIEETIPTWNALYYAMRMSLTQQTYFKYDFNLPRRWGKTHLCGKLMSEFDNLFYCSQFHETCRTMCLDWNILEHRVHSITYGLDHLRGNNINYIVFDEVPKKRVDEILSYVHPKGYLSVGTLWSI